VSDRPIIEIENLWVWRRGNLALKDVSLAIGKVIAGLIKPDRGRVTVVGPTRETVGYVPQERSSDPQFPVTPQDIVEMGLYGSLGLIPRISAKERSLISRALAHVGMEEQAGRLFGELSGGQKQRVFIARAIVGEPRLLLLDEPTTGVDARARDRFYRLLSQLRADLGLTIMLASHDLEVVPTQVDEIICINQMVYVHAPPEAIGETDALSRAYGCELEFMAHGKYPHRVIGKHDEAAHSQSPEREPDV
jgi:zinc transport system ATP-binding protein